MEEANFGYTFTAERVSGTIDKYTGDFCIVKFTSHIQLNLSQIHIIILVNIKGSYDNLGNVRASILGIQSEATKQKITSEVVTYADNIVEYKKNVSDIIFIESKNTIDDYMKKAINTVMTEQNKFIYMFIITPQSMIKAFLPFYANLMFIHVIMTQHTNEEQSTYINPETITIKEHIDAMPISAHVAYTIMNDTIDIIRGKNKLTELFCQKGITKTAILHPCPESVYVVYLNITQSCFAHDGCLKIPTNTTDIVAARKLYYKHKRRLIQRGLEKINIIASWKDEESYKYRQKILHWIAHEYKQKYNNTYFECIPADIIRIINMFNNN